MVAIRYAHPGDAPALAQLASSTFAEAFGADNRPEDVAQHVARAYDAAIQAREIADPLLDTLLCEAANELIAYAQLREGGSAPTGVPVGRSVELWRFYIARPWHGRGLAAELMRRVVEAAHARGAHDLWLGVWEHNHRARRFYEKCGFAQVGSHAFVLGTDVQTDLVLSAPLDAIAAHLDAVRPATSPPSDAPPRIVPAPDSPAIRALLRGSNLPDDDLVDGHGVSFLRAGAAARPDGVVGIEPLGGFGLLRSLAVAPEARGGGVGRALVAAAEDRARRGGLRTLFLLTTSAEPFFARLGYQRIAREDAPEAVRRTSQFAGLCPASAVLMMKSLSSGD